MEEFIRRVPTREVKIGDRVIGGDNPILIQSMCNTRTDDVESTVEQILELESAGCDIIRVAVPDMRAAESLGAIKEKIHIPLVADIHFDYRLAIAAIENGADKIRINPGNIGSDDKVRAVVEAARKKDIPIRVGVNSGSLEKDILAKYGRVTAEGLVESAMNQVRLVEKFGYDNLVISIKSSDVVMSIRAYEMISKVTDHPLHTGITEAGIPGAGTVRSSVGLGVLLREGIGDTIRVSLTGDPLPEVQTAKEILRSLGLRKKGIQIVSCPTCGRTKIDVVALARRVEEMAAGFDDLDIKIAVMGCAVNGPGETKEADLGIAGGDGEGLVIAHGEIIKKVPEDQLLAALREELEKMVQADR